MDSKSIDIPEILFSYNTGAPFTQCLECDKDLTEPTVDYFVEKVFRNYQDHKAQDVIIDYAICVTCAQKFYQKISQESMQNIQQYLGKAMEKNMRRAMAQNEELFERCVVHDTAISESEEYQIFGHCRGTKLLLNTPPYAIGWKAINEISTKLSQSTKDEMDGFFNKHFTPDPDLFAHPTKPKLVLI